jgi:RNA polymerase sigma-70 factor (ECF subfamily)
MDSMNTGGPSAIHPLANAFLKRRAGALSSVQELDNLESALCRLVSRASGSWEGLSVSPTAFVAFVADRLGLDLQLERALDELAAEDLGLVFACLAHNARAIHHWDQLLRETAMPVIRNYGLTDDRAQDFLQEMRENLLLGGENAEPKMAMFSGTGSLRAWLRIVLLRNCQRFKKRDPRRRTLEATLTSMVAPADRCDPELQMMARQHNALIAAALKAAIRALDESDRRVLRGWLVTGMTLEEIGQSEGVHRTTAARWLSRIRTSLLKTVRLKLAHEFGRHGSSLESILGELEGRIDASMTAFFEESASGRSKKNSAGGKKMHVACPGRVLTHAGDHREGRDFGTRPRGTNFR